MHLSAGAKIQNEAGASKLSLLTTTPHCSQIYLELSEEIWRKGKPGA